MRTVNLGRSGLLVSRLALGTALFGSRLDDAACARMVDRFLDAGGNLIDTADIYGRVGLDPTGVGRAEEAVGRAIRGRRERVVLATKGYWLLERTPRPNARGSSRRYLVGAIEASLRRLGADHIDLYQCHIWDPYTPVEETLGVLDDAVRAGRIRYYGVSNWDGWHVAKGAALAQAAGHAPILSDQTVDSLADRGAERSIIPACRDAGVSVIAWGALAQGFLSGRYQRGSTGPDPGSRIRSASQREASSWQRLAHEGNWRLIDILSAVADERGASMASVAIGSLLALGTCDVAILGAPDDATLANQLGADGLALDADESTRIRAASEPPPAYPTDMYGLFIYRDSPWFGGARPGGEEEGGSVA